MGTSSLDYLREARRWRLVLRDFPYGVYHQYAARRLAVVVVSELSRALRAAGSPILVALEFTGDNDDEPKSLIVWNGFRTLLHRLELSSNLIRIGDRPIFLAHEDGPHELVEKIIELLEAALDESDANAA